MSRRYVERALTAGDQVELVEIGDCGHYELIDPASAAWTAVLAAIERQAQPVPHL